MGKADLKVSYKSKWSDFPKGPWEAWPFNEKIRLFEEQVQGWTINVAKEIRDKKIKHADFALLAILLAYFENISKFMYGYDGQSASKDYFIKGVRSVYPKKFHESTIKLFYSQARSGMYHAGITGAKVELNCSTDSGVHYKNKKIILCPSNLLDEIQTHFNQYCKNLKNPSNRKLRSNFEKRYKFLVT